MRAGYPVNLERAGLTPEVQQIITKVIRSPPIDSGEQRSPLLELLVAVAHG